MTYKKQLYSIKRQLFLSKAITLDLPKRFSFKVHNIIDFEHALSFFDWDLQNQPVRINLQPCTSANYQAVSLLVLYAWALKNNGCTVSFLESDLGTGATDMWKRIGARGTFPVLFVPNQQFKGDKLKPLLAVRNNKDFKSVIESADSYTEGFNVEYASTLRYVLSELMYNTIEHGIKYGNENIRNAQIPSLAQFTWYKSNNEIHFIIADVGVGIKTHIEQAYPGQESDVDAIRLALKSQRSGTFGKNDPYISKNNAGMGLYISSNIIRRLNADMYVVSGNGAVHISPRDVTNTTLTNSWPGTFVLVTLRIENNPTFELTEMMQEFRASAEEEQLSAQSREKKSQYYLSIENYFGTFAEDKEAAIKFRDSRLFPELNGGKTILVDFKNVTASPHSFLSALFASPIKSKGLAAYKTFKFVNAISEIRETMDFILDENTNA